MMSVPCCSEGALVGMLLEGAHWWCCPKQSLPSGSHPCHVHLHALHAGDSESLERVFAALSCFGEDRGLDRSLEIAADLNNMAKVSTLEHPAELSPSPNACAYAEYLCRLGLLCTEEDDTEKIEEASLRWGAPPSIPSLRSARIRGCLGAPPSNTSIRKHRLPSGSLPAVGNLRPCTESGCRDAAEHLASPQEQDSVTVPCRSSCLLFASITRSRAQSLGLSMQNRASKPA